MEDGHFWQGNESAGNTLNERILYWDKLLEQVDSVEDPVIRQAIDSISEAFEEEGYSPGQACLVSGQAVWSAPSAEEYLIGSTVEEGPDEDGVTVHRGSVIMSAGMLSHVSVANFGQGNPLRLWLTFETSRQELASSSIMNSDQRIYWMHVAASTAKILPTERLEQPFAMPGRLLTQDEQAQCDDYLHVLSHEFNEHEDDEKYKNLPQPKRDISDWEFVRYAESEVRVRDMPAAIAAQNVLVALANENGVRYESINVDGMVLYGVCRALQPIDKRDIPFCDYKALNPRELCLTSELQVDLEQDGEVILPSGTIVQLPLFSQKVALLPQSN